MPKYQIVMVTPFIANVHNAPVFTLHKWRPSEILIHPHCIKETYDNVILAYAMRSDSNFLIFSTFYSNILTCNVSIKVYN